MIKKIFLYLGMLKPKQQNEMKNLIYKVFLSGRYIAIYQNEMKPANLISNTPFASKEEAANYANALVKQLPNYEMI